MAPTTSVQTPKAFTTVSKTMSKRMKVQNAGVEERWFKSNTPNVVEKGLKMMERAKLRTSYFPNGVGVMKMFPTPLGLRMDDVKVISGVDENKKLCLLLTKEQYDFYSTMQTEIMSTIVPAMKMQHPKWVESEGTDVVRVSENSGNAYIKTKVQDRGMSRTLGVGMEGEDILNHDMALAIPGTVINAVVGINGSYLSGASCGLITSISLYRVKSTPSEEEIKEQSEKAMRERDAERAEELRNF